jgi:hypothetical protein
MASCPNDKEAEKGLVGKMKDLYEDEKHRIAEKGIGGTIGEDFFY